MYEMTLKFTVKYEHMTFFKNAKGLQKRHIIRLIEY